MRVNWDPKIQGRTGNLQKLHDYLIYKSLEKIKKKTPCASEFKLTLTSWELGADLLYTWLSVSKSSLKHQVRVQPQEHPVWHAEVQESSQESLVWPPIKGPGERGSNFQQKWRCRSLGIWAWLFAVLSFCINMGKSPGLTSSRDCWALRLESNPEKFNHYTRVTWCANAELCLDWLHD